MVQMCGGSIFLWTVVVVIFFRRFIGNFFAEANYAAKDQGKQK
jgi:hypothetical protein